jgi:hypothetical protein
LAFVVNFKALIFAALFCGGCIGQVAVRCPRCAVVDALHPALPRPRRDASRLFVLVPGVLGYGWEWDGAVKALRHSQDADFFVFWWEPWSSLRRASDELHDTLERALYTSPPSVKKIVVVAHSAGGMVAAHALAHLIVPPGRQLLLVTIGTPFAGMMGPPFSIDDPLDSPVMIGIMGTFRRYPKPPPGVSVVEYVTSWPADPVMQPRYGHEVAPPNIGPRGARRISVDPHFDHNQIVSKVVIGLLNDHGPPVTIRP